MPRLRGFLLWAASSRRRFLSACESAGGYCAWVLACRQQPLRFPEAPTEGSLRQLQREACARVARDGPGAVCPSGAAAGVSSSPRGTSGRSCSLSAAASQPHPLIIPPPWACPNFARASLSKPAGQAPIGAVPALVLVVFLGGVTYAEIAALRKLEEVDRGVRRYVIFTTGIINHKKLLDAFKQKDAPNEQPETI
eukprot:GHVT01077738.1.p1 GENE.GHVT01077738.1~~GHVT01077738.1.p1  ORF type:complete len:195 (-),score=52.72 GHVT01077738.1:405-989(-)